MIRRMAAAPPRNDLRLDRAEVRALARALAISICIHALAYGGWRLDQKNHWLEKIHLPAWLARAREKLAIIPALRTPPPPAHETPLLFVDASPAPADAPPAHAKYYSSKNSRAANPDATAETGSPKISGKQTHSAKAEDVPRTQQAPPRPAAPATPSQQPAAETPPQSSPKSRPAGELAMARPEAQLRPDENLEHQNAQPKPRTIAEALMRQAAKGIAAEKSRQDGGVKHRAIQAAFDTVATPFGAYDEVVIAAIQSRWYALLDSQPLTRGTGHVTIRFHLNSDGSVSDLDVEENTVGELLGALCQRGIRDPAPFSPWPDDMKRMVGANFRDVKFTFFYD